MARVEGIMVGVLIVLALMLGVLFGGAAIWFLKPSGQERIVEKTTNRFVCADGSVKINQGDCPPITMTNSDGKTTVVCPPCVASSTIPGTSTPAGSGYDYASCQNYVSKCSSVLVGLSYQTTTTVTPPPVCKPCTTPGECGQPSYSDLRCRNGQEYKIYKEPLCEDSCCKTKETQSNTRACLDSEICNPTKGCLPIPPDAP